MRFSRMQKNEDEFSKLVSSPRRDSIMTGLTDFFKTENQGLFLFSLPPANCLE